MKKRTWLVSILSFGLGISVINGFNQSKVVENVVQAKNSETAYYKIITEAKKSYKKNNVTYKPYMQEYKPDGDFLNFSHKNFYENTRLKFDKDGIPMVNYYGKYYYNPVTTSNVALSEYGKFIKNNDEKNKEKFLVLADALIKMQNKDGSFRYTFDFKKPEYNIVLKKGWVSAMAQGEALSVYSRAFILTKNEKYLIAGKKSLEFLQVSKSNGGVMTDLGDISKKLKKNIWFEEYVTNKNNYTLNGYMFTLLGIYDWSKINANNDYGQKKATGLFIQGISSLKEMLKKYDLGGFTMYDLSHYTMKIPPHMVANYHAIHIYQLQALYSITLDTYLKNTKNKWASYVEK